MGQVGTVSQRLFGVLSGRFGTVPGLFEVPDSPTAFVSGFPAAGFDFPGRIWYVSVVAVAHVVVPGTRERERWGDFRGR